MLKRLLGGDALSRIHCQHAIDQRLRFGRYCVPFGRGILKKQVSKCFFAFSYIVSAGFDLRVESVLILVPERRIADEQNVEDNSTRPDVHRLPIALFLEDLRREITRCTGEAWSNSE